MPEPRTCSQCKHWRKLPKQDMANLDEPYQGECRQAPPTIVAVGLVQTPMGAQIANIAAYPRVPEQFPACGQFEANQILAEGTYP